MLGQCPPLPPPFWERPHSAEKVTVYYDWPAVRVSALKSAISESEQRSCLKAECLWYIRQNDFSSNSNVVLRRKKKKKENLDGSRTLYFIPFGDFRGRIIDFREKKNRMKCRLSRASTGSSAFMLNKSSTDWTVELPTKKKGENFLQLCTFFFPPCRPPVSLSSTEDASLRWVKFNDQVQCVFCYCKVATLDFP